jgi:hypothetical protein
MQADLVSDLTGDGPDLHPSRDLPTTITMTEVSSALFAEQVVVIDFDRDRCGSSGLWWTCELAGGKVVTVRGISSHTSTETGAFHFDFDHRPGKLRVSELEKEVMEGD